ncbi:class II aldolase/adducin domain-containing protein [Marasmius fiardii PR-910]|nr:class II aldolase/adducin domain-containing protein [Marasmius fiardii PR-910]
MADALHSQSEVGNKILDKMRASLPRPPTFSDKMEERAYLKYRLAQALRIFGKRGFDEGVAGHITVRDPISPNCFWVNPFGFHFKLIQPSDLLLVDSEGNILDESGPYRVLNVAAFMIHSRIHEARPDVICAAHSHSLYGKVFSALGVPLDMISQDACAFYKDYALYTQYGGVVQDEEEGKSIAKALGSCKAAILQNHGLLVATDNVEASVFFYIALEKACQVQLMADAAAAARNVPTVKIPDSRAAETGRIVGRSTSGWLAGSMEFKALEAEEGVSFEYKQSK